MTSLLRYLALAALGTAALLAGATSAGAAKPKMTKYTYKVEVTGVETSTWKLDHQGSGGCDPTQHGSGKETIRFSSKPTVLHTYSGLSQPYFFSAKGGATAVPKVKLRGSANRQGSLETSDTNCPGTGGGTTIPPDCGSRPLTGLTVAPQYEAGSDRMTLTEIAAATGQFRNCHGGGATFPHLLTSDTGGKAIGQSLPVDDLFNQGKNIIIARGTYKHSTGDLEYTTKIRWELSFTRLKVEEL